LNKKDTEHIGYILSSSRSVEELKERFFQMDSRIEQEYEMFESAAGREESIDDEVSKRMIERYGHNWALLKKKPPFGEVLEEVRREVYGDDYDYIFKK